MILNTLGAGVQTQRLGYQRFMEEGLLREIENHFAAVQWQAALGDETFVQKIRDRVRSLGRQGREITPLRRLHPMVAWEKVLERVAKGDYGLQARNVAMWMLWEGGGKSLREIGELFGGMDYAAVAQRIHRARLADDEKSASKLREQILNIYTLYIRLCIFFIRCKRRL
jgi:hypothetical protein